MEIDEPTSENSLDLSQLASSVGCGFFYDVEDDIKINSFDTGPILENLKSVDEELKVICVDRISDGNVQLLHLMKQMMNVQRQKDPTDASVTMKDIHQAGKNSNTNTNPALWTDILRLNHQVCGQTEAFLASHSENIQQQEENDKKKDNINESSNSAPKSFRDFYMSKMTDSFADDLDSLRNEDNFDETKITSLIDALESGVNIWDDYKEDSNLWSS